MVFRNLKPETDRAIELFANKNAQEDIILEPYEDYLEKFEYAVSKLLSITPDIASVDALQTEEGEAKEEGLDRVGLQKILSHYLFTEKTPMRDEVIKIMNAKPSLRERSTVAERVINKIKGFVETFIDGVD